MLDIYKWENQGYLVCELTLQAEVLVVQPNDLNLIPQDPHVCPLTAICVLHHMSYAYKKEIHAIKLLKRIKNIKGLSKLLSKVKHNSILACILALERKFRTNSDWCLGTVTFKGHTELNRDSGPSAVIILTVLSISEFPFCSYRASPLLSMKPIIGQTLGPGV